MKQIYIIFILAIVLNVTGCGYKGNPMYVENIKKEASK